MTDTLLATATRAIAKRSFGVLATTSDASRPHVAGVLYSAVGHTLYVSTLRDSRKARNIAANPRVAVTVPVRRLPVGPPSGVQFQGTARILDNDDPEVRDLAAAGRLKAISGHGELELDGGCVLRIAPGRRLVTFGLGMPLLSFLRDPLNAAGAVDLPVGTAV